MQRSGTILAALCAAGAAAAFLLPAANPDVFWHLSAARWMAEHLAFPHSDWLSFTMAGAPWADFEWLAELLWYAWYGAFGLGGLWAFKSLVLAAAGGMLWMVLGLYRVRPAARGLCVLFWAVALSYANDIRPENFSILFFLGVWGWLEARRLGRLKGVSLRAQAAGLVLLYALWANLHAGFVFGLLLTGIFAIAELLRRRSSELAGLSLLCALSALLNPYGVRVYTVPFEHWGMISYLETFIKEWQQPSIYNAWLWPFWAMVLLSFGAVLLRFVRKKDVPFEHIAALGVFGVSAAAHMRTSVYFVSAAVCVTASVLAAYDLPRRRPRLGRALLAAGMVLVWGFYAWSIPRLLLRGGRFRPAFVPVRLTAFLESERAAFRGKRLFNPWHWGGYLGWRLYPDVKVFTDGRYIFHRLLAPMYEAAGSPEDYAGFLRRYGVDAAAVERARQFRHLPMDVRGVRTFVPRPFYVEFFPAAEWALLYWDSQGCVFVRRSSFPAEWVREREFRLFRPDDLAAVRVLAEKGLVDRGALRAEFARHERWAGPSESRTWRRILSSLLPQQ